MIEYSPANIRMNGKTASEIHKERLTPEEINYLILSSYFDEISPFLIKVLKKSRDRKVSGIDLIRLQGEIATEVIKLEKSINYFKKTSKRQERNKEWLTRELSKAHRRFLRQIMDGLAFRLLNFNRPVLRQLAEHNQTGHLTRGFIEEMKKAEYIANKTGFSVILNDLTNFLRYGDLIVISPEGNIIDEVKTTGKSKGDQKKNLDNIIDLLNRNVFKAGDQTAQFLEIPGKPSNFLGSVESLINKAKQSSEGISYLRISPYLWVSCLYLPGLYKYSKQSKNVPIFPICPFPREECFPTLNSLMFFDEFSPNTPPPSIYPFPEEVIVEIMTGRIQLKTIVNEKLLIQSFKGKGWMLEMPSREKIIAVYDRNDINAIKKAVRDPKYHPTLSKGEFSYKIPREILLRIENEYLSVKAIIDEAEHIMKATSDRVPRMITTKFVEEHLIWK